MAKLSAHGPGCAAHRWGACTCGGDVQARWEADYRLGFRAGFLAAQIEDDPRAPVTREDAETIRAALHKIDAETADWPGRRPVDTARIDRWVRRAVERQAGETVIDTTATEAE